MQAAAAAAVTIRPELGKTQLAVLRIEREKISAVTMPCSATGELANVVAQLCVAADWGDHYQHHSVDAPTAGCCTVWQLQWPAEGTHSIIRSTS